LALVHQALVERVELLRLLSVLVFLELVEASRLLLGSHPMSSRPEPEVTYQYQLVHLQMV